MDREAENRGEHVTPDCRYCSSALRRHQNSWFRISSECPHRHMPLSFEIILQDEVATRTYPSTPAFGDAVSDGSRSITMDDVQYGGPGNQLGLEQSNDGDQQDHEQCHDYFREFQSDVNGTQGSRPSAAHDSAVKGDASHGEETIDREVHRDATSSWVGERDMLGEGRHSDVVRVLESGILNDLVIAVPVVASEVEQVEVEQVLEVSEDEDMEG